MFDIFKVLDLSKYGAEWEGCYLKFRSISLGEAQELTKINKVSDDEGSEQLITILKKYFVDGKAVSNGEVVEVKGEDLAKFPPEVLMDVFKLFTPELDEKKKSELSKSSEA